MKSNFGISWAHYKFWLEFTSSKFDINLILQIVNSLIWLININYMQYTLRKVSYAIKIQCLVKNYKTATYKQIVILIDISHFSFIKDFINNIEMKILDLKVNMNSISQ